MTLPSPGNTPRIRNVPYGSETILVLGGDPDTRAYFREVLSANGYRVLEAANYEHANAIVDELENGVDLMLACARSDWEASIVKDWHTDYWETPLLILPSTDQTTHDEVRTEEVVDRVRLALEAARPARSILVVDGDESERRVIAELLKTAGYEVTEAANGKQALALLASGTPDLLLTEIVMPEKDGLELIQDVRKRNLKTTILAMSGTAKADGYLSIARHLGAHRTLKKPLSVDQLLRVLREAPGPTPQ